MNYSNNSYSVLAAAITNSATSISVASGTGSRFPASNFLATLIGYDGSGNENAWEIVLVTARTGDVLTVTRAQEGTTAVAWASATRIENRITAGTMAAIDVAAGTTAQYWRGDKSWRDFATDVRATVITGLSVATNAAIAATDTVLAALGKLQAQITGITGITGLLKSNGTTVSAAAANTDYLPPASPTVSSGSLNFSNTGQRITGDFTNATVANRLMFQTTTANGSTLVEAIPLGTPTAGTTGGGFVASENSDPANGAVAQMFVIRGQEVRFSSGQRGTGTNLPMTFVAGGSVRMTLATSGAIQLAGGLQEQKVTMAANNIDLATGNVFSKTISGATTLTVSNVPASGTVATFILNLTNGGSATITWWSGVKWAGGTAPTLTAAGRDRLGFITEDGGTTWDGFVLGKAMA